MVDKSISIRKNGFADYSAYYLLDIILKSLTAASAGGRTMKGWTDITVLYRLLEENEVFLHDDEFRAIIKKLRKDKYISESLSGNGTEYSLTFEGLVFYLDGGYTQNKKEKDIQSSKEENEKAILLRYTKLSVRWTMVASIIGTLFFILEIYKLYINDWIPKP